MHTLNDARLLYERFYKQMRKYIWDVSTVIKLAQLEVSLYQAFPKSEDCRKYLDDLYKDIKPVMKDDDYLSKAYDNLKDYIYEDESSYLHIQQY